MSRATGTVVFCLLVGWVVAEEMTLSINVKKPLAVVSDKFLSVTLDPAFIFSEALSDVEKCTNMAKALAPAFIRIGGPRSNSYVFERGLYPQETHADPGYILSERHWIHVHQWAQRSGLDVIAVIAPQQSDSYSSTRSSSWDPRNALDLISFSDHMGYNISWQLGYECQTRCDVSGSDLGRDVQRLRNMLDAFPRYAEHALVAGPDVVTHKTRLQQQYLQEFFNSASAALSAVTWHPDFASISLEEEGVSMHLDGLALEKDSLYRIIGKQVAKKPLWIAESRPEECKHQFLGALVWARRLGNTAKLGAQVLMRQPEISNFFKPTPDYWVSVLHKMLVGQEVLDTRIATGNRTHVHFYSHCSKPSERYEPGSVTVFGINLTPSKVAFSLKGLKVKVVHNYILLPGYDAPNRMFSESALLNNEPLNLIDGKEIPELRPVVISAERGTKLKLPSGAIGFWVLPGLKMKTCMDHEDELVDKNLLRRLTKRLDDVETEQAFTSEEGNHELSDLELLQLQGERRRLTRQQPSSLIRRILSRWSNRHREDERNEMNQRRPYRHDLDRLLWRRDYHPVGTKRFGNLGIKEIGIENGDSDNEYLNKNVLNMRTLDVGERLRSKFDDYKRRVTDSKKKPRDVGTSENKKMDTDKVIEALTLITQVENAMKSLEKDGNENKAKVTTVDSSTLATENLDKVTPALPQNNSIDDVLLVEVLNTNKSKGTMVPATIEEQLKALYQLLTDEKGLSSQRQKREINEGQETANIQQRDAQQRKRSKTDELRERRLERLNERRQRMRERLEQRRSEREQQENEANFYGFQELPPPKDFPQGDVFLEAGNDAENKDSKSRFQPNDPWERSDRLLDPAGHDYFENLKMREFGIKENSKGYGEFLDGNSLNKGDSRSVDPPHPPPFLGEPIPFKVMDERPVPPASLTIMGERPGPPAPLTIMGERPVPPAPLTIMGERPVPPPPFKVMDERPVPPLDNHRLMTQLQQQITPYFETNPSQEFYEFKDPRQYQQPNINFYQPPVPPPSPYFQHEPPMAPMQNFYREQPQLHVEPGNFFVDPRERQNPEQLHFRSKRQASNLEDILQREMILQDDNNLRDCQCRVIRGVQDCGDCEKVIINQEELSTNAVHQYAALDNYLPHIRLRRDTGDDIGVKIITEQIPQPTCPTTEDETTESQSDTVEQQEDTKEEEAEDNPEEEELQEQGEETQQVSEEDSNTAKEIESTTDIMKDYLKPETDSDKLLANRLPRKIGYQPKFFQASRRSTFKTSSKEDSFKDRNEAARTAEFSSSSSKPNAYEPISSTEERLAKARSINYSIGQSTGSTPAETTIKISKEAAIEKHINSQTSIDIGKKNSEVGKQNSPDLKQHIVSQRMINQAINAPVSENPIKTSSPVSRLKKSLKNSQKTTTTESNYQLKSEVEKVNESKNKQTRLTTRAEALAALRKENESRRVKKMIEASLRMLDSENERFLEFQKRREEQLEKLRMKLRAKREKLLEQYRDELLEVISESRDSDERNLYRRDLLHFETPLEAEEANAEKFSSRPSRSLDDQLQGKMNNEEKEQQDSQSENLKRSPDNIVSAFSKFKWRNRYRKKPQVEHLDDESGEYYVSEEPEPFYYSYGIDTDEEVDNKINKNLELQMDYNQKPQVNEQGNYHYYNIDEYVPIEDISHNYYSYEAPRHHLRKAKRSSLKHVEIDPAMYEEDEPDYNLQELLMRPSSHISSRTYRHYPHELIDTRYKREAVLNDGETLDIPMSISLGLEKSKMKKSKTKSVSTSEDLIRRKRFTEDPFQKSSSINKNVKKVYFEDYENSFKNFPDSDKKIIKRVIKSVNTKGYNDLKNHLNNNEATSERRKRSHESNMSRYRLLTANDIDRSEDSEMDEIWNNIIEMKQDEELLQEYSRHKAQEKLQKIIETTEIPLVNEINSIGTKTTVSTTQTNIESIFVDAIPKLETVITGGLKKAQNLTGSLEDFIEKFDDQFEETTAISSNNSTGLVESEESNDGRLSHNLFKAVVANVKKFFGMVSGFTKIFHGR